ncbi:Bax inhibitor-1/YccA family protein [Pseudonocardia asaccharolytica]|uniref:Membrane protein n=1 Tax=Pseudonocardia asaccharolytica DSM 44247 = NBRC 16224 TaxID=1123024 RepID=A0A511D454_9PSEU|nr:Bax inhibitor-1/YccA family protein [Pseudonocardia asaccharolytica]GEL19561.1 membrane protein [Pseudonocardia asaccharolytica DSM 44247 = NBRC 16224]
MRTSSNPAFRNLPGGQGGYATFGRQGGMMGGATAYADAHASQVEYGRAGTGERPLTIDDVVTKTAISAGVAIVAGALTALAGPALAWIALPAFIVGFVISLIVIFKQSSNPALVLTYSAAMGVALGGIAGVLNGYFPGIAFQALIGTAGVFVGMLVVYKTGAVRVTPRFTKWLMGAMIGVVVLMVANLIGNLFGADLGLRSGGPLAIIFSLVVIGVAAFSLLLDFDMADKAIRAGAPAKFAWYIAFGLMTTLVWLYIEILRLLSYLRQD